MKTIYATSYNIFKASLEMTKIDDSNIEEANTAIIEIMGEQDLLFFPFYFKRDHPNVLRLLFDDVDERLDIKLFGEPEDEREYIPVVPMSESQGLQIVDFLIKNAEKKQFIVHCAAGVSRSGAIASFIREYFNEDEDLFNRKNPYIKPNIRILSILRNLSKK